MGTCAITLHKPDKVANVGPFRTRIADMAMSNSYATGGDTVTLSSLGLKTLESFRIVGYTNAGAALFHVLTPIYATTNLGDIKIMARDVATGAQVTNAFDASTMIVRIEATGEGPF